jgi:hypothetical protein
VARLTADNLVFMAKLRAAESAAAAASAERDELVLALEEHKGPWMDEVGRKPITVDGCYECMFCVGGSCMAAASAERGEWRWRLGSTMGFGMMR